MGHRTRRATGLRRGTRTLIALLLACNGTEPSDEEPRDSEPVEVPESSVEAFHVTVAVTLDGEPVEGATVLQGGTATRHTTDVYGRAVVDIDTSMEGDWAVVGSHPEARTWWVDVFEEDNGAVLDLELTRYDTTDNVAYTFRDPGEPDRRDTTNQCSHCHISINEDWHASPHATSASNPDVQAVFAQLPADEDGDCAACHAPGIDGELSGRRLDEATGIALDHGVHCDVCHRVESVDLDDPDPGVAGKLVVHRPGEDGGISFEWKPLIFGPYDDVPNLAMGSVARDLFTDETLCAGCHEHDQPAIEGTIDTERWSDGRVPIHSTYSEWKEGPLNEIAPCQSCHMPPDPDVGNSADLGATHSADSGESDALPPGVVAGWYRPPGAVRRHSWVGPRTPDSDMLQLAASLQIEKSVDEDVLTARVTTKNVGPAHAIPTGEPSRNLILLVTAACDEELVPLGGDVVPDYGGSDPSASEFRVVERGEDIAYTGPLDFAERLANTGIPSESYVGLGTAEEGQVAYGIGEGAYAGHPGWGFARVLVDSEGERMVPHWRAVDMVSDNRLMPQAEWTSTHLFAATCAEPTVTATLIHRAYPWGQGFDTRDQVMVEIRQ